MDNRLHTLLLDIDEIHLQMHCAVESVRQCYVAMTQGDTAQCVCRPASPRHTYANT